MREVMLYILSGILLALVLCFFKLIEIASRLKSIDHTSLAEHQVSDSRFSTTNEHLAEMREAVVNIENLLELIENKVK